MNEQIEKLARELFQIAYETTWTWEQVSKHEHAIWIKMAKFVLERELESRIQELCSLFPELNSDSGITIQIGSRKEWALKRKIELDNQLQQLRGGE